MIKRSVSQEFLKLIACITMLIDHIGAIFIPGYALRIIGRLSFPIYCFLLAEGVRRTGNLRRYGLRLAISMMLAELPFDLAFWGRWTWAHQSVMVTLLLGFLALTAMEKCGSPFGKLLITIPFVLLAQWMRTDYGGAGVCLIVLFGMTRDMPHKYLLQLLGMVVIFDQIPGLQIRIGGYYLPVQMFAILSLIPIALYSGRKVTGSKLAQWGFYLFYPVHLAVLYCIKIL